MGCYLLPKSLPNMWLKQGVWRAAALPQRHPMVMYNLLSNHIVLRYLMMDGMQIAIQAACNIMNLACLALITDLTQARASACNSRDSKNACSEAQAHTSSSSSSRSRSRSRSRRRSSSSSSSSINSTSKSSNRSRSKSSIECSSSNSNSSSRRRAGARAASRAILQRIENFMFATQTCKV